MIEQAVRLRGLRGGILPFSTVFGGREDHSGRVNPAFRHAALKDATPVVYGAQAALDPTWIDDVVDGVRRLADALTRGKFPGRPILLSGGAEVPLVDLASLLRTRVGSRSQVAIRPPRSFDVERFAGSPRYAREFLGRFPTTAVDEGIADYPGMLMDAAEA